MASSAKLAKDVIFQEPITFIPKDAWRLNRQYSILVRQYNMEKKSFEYWQNMKKNSEELGSIFAPQPSEFGGNIHSISTPGEPVIGYFSADGIVEKRIFINSSQVPGWRYSETCTLDTVKKDEAYSRWIFLGGGIGLYFFVGEKEVLVADPICVDCALRGSPVKPTFWK
jgi:hypothetical protein